ncbi:MAG: hypothetical protein KDB94_02360 [Acidobacteria bacterium]|nr:hypothetical protein [Phycisphaerales bacterium]MCB1007717.1 hypothetical protein [Acidobacteriota bacterium]
MTHPLRKAAWRFLILGPIWGVVAAGAQTVFHVPGDYSNIQSAINAASSGDTVIVGDGTFTGTNNRDLRIWGKAITVRSAHGPSATTIDCSLLGRGFLVIDGEGQDTVIEGFTIQNCRATGANNGAGIYVNYASPTIRNCLVRFCLSESKGGGLYTYSTNSYAPVRIEGSTFFYNTAWAGGGGVWARNAVIVGSTFSTNQAGQDSTGVPANGGGAYVASSQLHDNLFIGNRARRGGGIAMDGAVTLVNALFQDNSADVFGATTNQGGAAMIDGPDCSVAFATFSGNWASSPPPPGDTYGHTFFLNGWNADIAASILWDANSPEAFAGTGIPNVSLSDVKQASGTYPGSLNMNSNPLFASGPEGGFYLSQVAAGQASTSGCVNWHTAAASTVCPAGPGDLCLDRFTTRTDHVPDSGDADIGFHRGKPLLFRSDFEIGRLSDWSVWSPM